MNIIPILPQSASGAGATAADSSSLPSSQGLNNMFLQLLVAQLQNQNPLDPMDPTQFVGQLAQFSELSEVTQIEQLLQQAMPTSPAAGSGSGSGSSEGSGHVVRPADAATAASEPLPDAITSAAASAAQTSVPISFLPAASILNQKIQGVF